MLWWKWVIVGLIGGALLYVLRWIIIVAVVAANDWRDSEE